MKNKTIGLSAIAIILLFAASCTKNNVSDFPNLTLNKPTSGQVFNPGDTFRIQGSASASASDDAHLLHDVMLEVLRTSDSASLFSAHYSTHMKESFDFDTFFIVPSVSVMTDAFVLAQTANHIPRVTAKTVPVMIQP